VPIYDSGQPSHDAYLNQLIDMSMPLCKHTENPGQDYTKNKANRTLPDTTIMECIHAACNDSQCVAYTFKANTSYLYYEIPSVTNVADTSIISGTIDHTTPVTISSCSANDTNTPPLLASVLHAQTSFSYKTCFETVDSANTLESHNLYVIICPKGITMGSSNFNGLRTQMGGTLHRYRCPVSIRGADPTLRTYRYDESGNKLPDKPYSSEGHIYTSPLSSCTDEFRQRIEFFAQAPKPSSSVTVTGTDTCKYNSTKQYKCVALNKLNQLHEGDIASAKTLDQCITANYTTPPTSDSSSSVEEMELLAGVVGSVVVGIIGILGVISAYQYFTNKPKL